MAKAKSRKGTKTKVEILHPAQAAEAAFTELNDLECVSLMKGNRTEDVVSTGSLILDLISGGGLQRGRCGSIFGPEASGKSTLLQAITISGQSLDIPVVHYDPEAGADPVYMRTQGVDLRKALDIKVREEGKRKFVNKEVPGYFYSQPDTGESIYRHIIRTLGHMPDVESGLPTIIFLIDSFAAMMSEEVDPTTGEGGRLADSARMHSHYLALVKPKLRRKGAVLIGTNQMRANIAPYGADSKEAGGNALKYYMDYKLKVNRQYMEGCKPGGVKVDKIGVNTLPLVWRTVKNKWYPPFRSTDMRLVIGRGIDFAFDAHYFFLHTGWLEESGGKRRLLLDRDPKFLDWRTWRRRTHNPKFRAKCFELLKDQRTYRRYFEKSAESTYFYDEEYDLDEEDMLEIEKAIEEEAEEYKEQRKTARKKGKRPRGKTKAEDKEDLDLEDEFE